MKNAYETSSFHVVGQISPTAMLPSDEANHKMPVLHLLLMLW